MPKCFFFLLLCQWADYFLLWIDFKLWPSRRGHRLLDLTWQMWSWRHWNIITPYSANCFHILSIIWSVFWSVTKKPQVLLSNSWRSGNKSSVSVCVNAGTVSNSSHLRSSDVCKPRVCWPPRRGVSAANHRVITKTQAPLSSNIIVSDDHDVVWRRVCCRWWCIGRRLGWRSWMELCRLGDNL